MGDIANQRSKPHVGHSPLATRHSPLGALMIYNRLISIALIGMTGWTMTTNMFRGAEGIEDMHEGLVVRAGARSGFVSSR
ncbi:MAG: hypothetical protein L3J30_11470 [Marinosulfonomonas sp.]|nr:hypothetical protein [Marinosulfonomonas sp.]